MKFIIPIIVLLFSVSAFSQSGKQREILLVSTEYYNQKCEHVAFKISQRQIEVDNCYNMDTKVFNATKTIDIKSERVLLAIYKMSLKDLKYYQNEINAVHDCDTIKPITIIVSEKGIKTTMEWKGIKNCYPLSVRKVVESLESLFIKYK